jgi:hypothetical protein
VSSVEIKAKTKIAISDERGEIFPAGTDVLLLDQDREEWFAEFTIPDESRPTGKRYAYVMVHQGDLDIEQ